MASYAELSFLNLRVFLSECKVFNGRWVVKLRRELLKSTDMGIREYINAGSKPLCVFVAVDFERTWK